MIRSSIRWLAAAVLLGATLTAAPGHAAAQQRQRERPSPMGAYRDNVMGALRSHLGAVRAIAQNNLPLQDQVLEHAVATYQLSLMVGNMFPAGSGEGNTHALPAIWSNPQDFAQKVQALQDAANQLVTAAQAGDNAAVTKALTALGGTCRDCHDKYRKEEERGR